MPSNLAIPESVQDSENLFSFKEGVKIEPKGMNSLENTKEVSPRIRDSSEHITNQKSPVHHIETQTERGYGQGYNNFLSSLKLTKKE